MGKVGRLGLREHVESVSKGLAGEGTAWGGGRGWWWLCSAQAEQAEEEAEEGDKEAGEKAGGERRGRGKSDLPAARLQVRVEARSRERPVFA